MAPDSLPAGGPLDLVRPRFLAPAGRPRVIAREAATAASAAKVPLRLGREAALALLRDREFDFRKTLFQDVTLGEPLAPIEPAAGGDLHVGEPPPGPPLRRDTDAGASAGALRRALASAVADALRPAGHAAVTLSGGLDSSVVAAAAVEAWSRLGRPASRLRFYHLLPPSGPTEVEHARAVARHLGRDLVEVETPDTDPYEGAEALLAANDFPSDGGGPAAWTGLGSRFLEDGIDTVLTGDAGDEAAGKAITGRGGLRGVASRARALLGRAFPSVRGEPAGGEPPWLESRARGIPRVIAAPPPRRGLSEASAARDASLRSGRQSANLGWLAAFDRVYRTRTSVPFLDPRVQDAALSIPADHFAQAPGPKRLLRLAFAEALPRAQRDRPKDQPRWEPLFHRDFERFGAAWADRYVRGGVIERIDLTSYESIQELFRRVGQGSAADLPLALTLVGLAAWATSRGF